MERQYDSTSAQQPLSEITQFGIKLLFRVAVVSQTDSGKTHSIMHSWLGGKISYWKPNEHGAPEHAFLQHCLFCSSGGISNAEKDNLVKHFVVSPEQRLFHMPRFPTKQELFEFISSTTVIAPPPLRKRKKTVHLQVSKYPEDIAFNEDQQSAPNRVVVFDDLMTEAFSNKDNESMMNLITTKLSHHNNLSILIVCHELYSKGKNSVLFRDQLSGVHLHAIANQQRIRRYIYGFLSDDVEKHQFDKLFNEHVLCINDSVNGNRRGSIFIRFTPSLSTDCFGTTRQIGRFLTFNESGFSVIHETHH